ncbi:MAG TPA: SPOR domain-containing protein [Candidatus Coprenecus stercoripullorum]|nr:SPOR domain-containing protein [Candidatus Coprenecus stercoripullorum]
MRKCFVFACAASFFFCASCRLQAQDTLHARYAVDSLFVNDSTLVLDSLMLLPVEDTVTYQELIEYLGEDVVMSDSIGYAMLKQIDRNALRKVPCYRIRIYFDNSQDARTVSDTVAVRFSRVYPDVPVYRTYANPYFKVTVGDFFSRSDAMRFLEVLKPEYPTVFLVRETFSTT